MTVLAKQPSEGLIEMIKVAAGSLLEFGALWGSIKKKGGEEGFSEKELQEMLRPHLKQKMDSKKIWYLFHKEEQIERVQKNQEENRTKFSTNDVEKVIEQRHIPEELPPNAPTKTSEQFYAEQKGETEEPTELELAEIKIKHLEEALHKTEQFKPASTMELDKPPNPEDEIFDWLGKRDNGVNCYWFPNYGIELFKSRVLTDLKGRGVKTFKRLYFEV